MGMLVLTREIDEEIVIVCPDGTEITHLTVDIRGGNRVRHGISAPPEYAVHRREVWEAIKRENRAAAQVKPEEPGPPVPGAMLGGVPAPATSR